MAVASVHVMDSEPASVAVVRSYLEAAERADAGAMVALTEPSFEFGSLGSRLSGHASLRAAIATPRPMTLALEPQHWFADGADVVCVAKARFRWRHGGAAAGEAPRVLRAEVRGGRLCALRRMPDAAASRRRAASDECAAPAEAKCQRDQPPAMMASPVQPPFVADKPVTAHALDWAAERHHGQLRDVDSAPFILHPLEVAALLSGRGYEDAVVAAGLLHDVVEDTAASAGEVREPRRTGRRLGPLDRDPRAQVRRAASSRHEPAVRGTVIKAREPRAQASQRPPRSRSPARDRLEHYEQTSNAPAAVPDLPLAHQLEFELWALRRLPPPGRRDAT